jgi:hypothetical protein
MTINRTGLRFGVGILAFSVLSAMFLPRVLRQHGYALPGRNGIPCTIPYGHRSYVGPLECDRDYMYGKTLNCRSQTDLINKGWWPLERVGSIPTLLGSSRPLFVESRLKQDTPTAVFMLVEPGCYVPYSLLGGP